MAGWKAFDEDESRTKRSNACNSKHLDVMIDLKNNLSYWMFEGRYEIDTQ